MLLRIIGYVDNEILTNTMNFFILSGIISSSGNGQQLLPWSSHRGNTPGEKDSNYGKTHLGTNRKQCNLRWTMTDLSGSGEQKPVIRSSWGHCSGTVKRFNRLFFKKLLCLVEILVWVYMKVSMAQLIPLPVKKKSNTSLLQKRLKFLCV